MVIMIDTRNPVFKDWGKYAKGLTWRVEFHEDFFSIDIESLVERWKTEIQRPLSISAYNQARDPYDLVAFEVRSTLEALGRWSDVDFGALMDAIMTDINKGLAEKKEKPND